MKMKLERPNYGEDYVKDNNPKEDYRIYGLCSAEKSERHECAGYQRIIEGCYFYNLFTGKCMRPKDEEKGKGSGE